MHYSKVTSLCLGRSEKRNIDMMGGKKARGEQTFQIQKRQVEAIEQDPPRRPEDQRIGFSSAQGTVGSRKASTGWLWS